MKPSPRNRRWPQHTPSLRRRPRLNVELLEDRNLMNNGQWLASLDHLRGQTRDDQMADAANRLHAAGIDDQDVRVINHVGVNGIVLVQTPVDANLEVVNKELQDVRGFRYVEEYDPLTDADERISQFPAPPRAEEGEEEMMHEGNGPPVSVAFGPTPGAAGPSAGPNIVTGLNGFPGIDNSNSFCGCSPPDTTGAAGPSTYIETVNSSLHMYNKDGTGGTTVAFSNFFSSLAVTPDFSDPIIVYNDITQRFFIGMLNYDFSSNSWLDVAISKTSDPPSLASTNWNFKRFNLDDPTPGFDFGDYPKLGYNADGYVITTNQFPDGNFYDHVAVLAIKNDLTTATGDQSIAVAGGFTHFTFAPARMHSAISDGSMWFTEAPGSADNASGNQITVVRMDNVFSASPSFTYTNVNVASYEGQPSPLGDRTGLGTRMYHSALRTVGGVTHLVAAHAVGVTDGPDFLSRVRWYDFDVTNANSPALFQQGEINQGSGIDTWFPDADIGPDGTIGMNFSQSTNFGPRAGMMDMYVTGRRGGDSLGTMQTPTLAVQGTGILDAFGRAGDYSFTTVDPIDGSFWAANEFSLDATSPNWATWIQHFTLAGLAVTTSTPAQGSTVASLPANYIVNFSDPVYVSPSDPPGLQASDFQVNGHAATGVSVSADLKTATFTFAINPVTTQGLQSMTIAGDSIVRNDDHTKGIQAFFGSFRYDAVTLAVTSTSPVAGSTIPLTGPLAYDVTFNEAVDAASVDLSDLTLSQGTVSSAVRDGSNPALVHYTISGLTTEGTLNVSIAGGAVTDAFSNPGFAGFSASYILDFDTIPYPTPLTPKLPLGSLIYDPTAAGLINPVGDTDGFTLSVAAGQTITVLVTPTTPGLQPKVELFNPSTVSIGSNTAAGAGQKALLQTVGSPTTAGLYKAVVSGAASTTGGYTVQVLLNAALEQEGLIVGATNNTIGTAQSIQNSFITVTTAQGTSADRGAVLGQTDGITYGPYTAAAVSTGFENISSTGTKTLVGVDDGTFTVSLPFAFPFYNSSYSSLSFSSNGLITFGGTNSSFTNSDLSSTPAQAAIAPYWDDLVVKDGKPAKSSAAAVLYQTIGSGASQHFVIQWNSVSYKATNPPKGGLTFEAVLYPSGDIQFNYSNLVSGTNKAPGASDNGKSATVGIKDASTAVGKLLLVNNNGPTALVSSNKSLRMTRTAIITPDLYSFTLANNDTTSLAVKGTSGGSLTLELLKPDGTTVAATGVGGPTNLDKVISKFAVGPTGGGTYYARIGGGGAAYNLVVTRNAAIDAEANDTFASAQDMTGHRGAIGFVSAGTDLFSLHGTPVSGGLVLAGSKITLGINPDGSFINGSTGIQFLGNEFVVPGSPVAGFTIGQAGSNYTNKGALGDTDISVTEEDLTNGAFHGVRIVGTVGGTLQLERVIAFNQDDEFATIATRLTNLSAGSISNVAWLENLDPDQGYPLNGNYSTYNDVVQGGQLVRADAKPTAYPSGLTIGLGSADSRRVVSADGFDNRDPFAIINNPVDPNGAFADIGINLAFNFGNLGAGQSTAGIMIMSFGRTAAEAESTYTAHTAGTLLYDEDWYSFKATAPTMDLQTGTPGDGGGQPGNTLSPHIQLYSSATTKLADGAKLLDGRNEIIHATGLTVGTTYYLRIYADPATRGEYFLDPPLETAPAMPLPVMASQPAVLPLVASQPAVLPVTASLSVPMEIAQVAPPLAVSHAVVLPASTPEVALWGSWFMAPSSAIRSRSLAVDNDTDSAFAATIAIEMPASAEEDEPSAFSLSAKSNRSADQHGRLLLEPSLVADVFGGEGDLE